MVDGSYHKLTSYLSEELSWYLSGFFSDKAFLGSICVLSEGKCNDE